MKYLIFIFFPFCLFSQDYDAALRVEVKDTFEVAYRSYLDGTLANWSDPAIQKDSIGIDSFTQIRLYWIEPTGKKRYMELIEKHYKGEKKAYFDDGFGHGWITTESLTPGIMNAPYIEYRNKK